MERYLRKPISADLKSKLVLISGPRQTGKTTLGQSFYDSTTYLNFDRAEDRKILKKTSWSRDCDLVVFDELHKMKNWKSWIKGVYDTEKRPPYFLVTGSARLDVFKKGGDSLAGRHFSYRLHPVSVAEAVQTNVVDNAELAQQRILDFGGFPEPFLSADETFVKRWRKSHIDRILREDLLDLEKVREIKSIEILVDLLSERVGSTVSSLSLARDLQVSPKTVKHWIEILERMFVIFVVTPYSKNIARSLLKEPKIYFYDTGRVKNDPGARFENLVACSLLKRNHFLEDTNGDSRGLHYIRDQQGREVDFLTTLDKKPEYLIETKVSDSNLSPPLKFFSSRVLGCQPIQLVQKLNRITQYGKIKVVPSAPWLGELEA